MTAPVPDRLKKLRGTARTDRARDEPAAGERLAKVPAAPAHLSARAQGEWARLAPLLVASGTLTASDLRALQLLCDTLASAADFADAIAADGLTVPAAGGGSKAHPGLNALAQARAQARALLTDFGLSPRARSAVEAAPASPARKGKDPLDEFTVAGEYGSRFNP